MCQVVKQATLYHSLGELSNLLFLPSILSEPTSNVAPKLTGKKYDGGKIELFAHHEAVFLTCDVVGYPAPLYR